MNTTEFVFLTFSLSNCGVALAQTSWDNHFQTGLAHYRAGRTEAAITQWRAAAADAKAFPMDDPRVARTWNNLAAAESAAGHYAEAEAAYGRALAARSLDAPSGLERAKTLNNLASLHRLTGRMDDAAAEVAQAWTVVETAADSDDRNRTLFHVLYNLAEIERGTGAVAKADETAAWLGRMAAQLGEQRLQADLLQLEAELAGAKGSWILAAQQQAEALEIYERQLPPTHPARIQAGATLGQLLMASGRLDEARPYLTSALASDEAMLGPQHPQVATALFNLARWQHERGELVGIDGLIRRAVAIWSAAYGPYHPAIASAWRELAQVFQMQGKYTGAEELYQRALKAAEKSNDGQRTREILRDLARLYETQQRNTAAARIHKQLALGLQASPRN